MKVTVFVSCAFFVTMVAAILLMSSFLDIDVWKIAVISITFTILTTLRVQIVADVYAWEKKKALGL